MAKKKIKPKAKKPKKRFPPLSPGKLNPMSFDQFLTIALPLFPRDKQGSSYAMKKTKNQIDLKDFLLGNPEG